MIGGSALVGVPELHTDPGPTAVAFGTVCCQVRWHDPSITSRSPGPGRNPIDAPPPAGRNRNGRTAPSDTNLTAASGSSRATRSPGQATLSAPSRWRSAPGNTSTHPPRANARRRRPWNAGSSSPGARSSSEGCQDRSGVTPLTLPEIELMFDSDHVDKLSAVRLCCRFRGSDR